MRSLLFLLVLFYPVAALSQIPINDRIDLIGDTRLLGAWQHGTDRDGVEINQQSAFLRLRLGVRYHIHNNLDISARYGMRLSDETRKLSPGLHTTGENQNGLLPGEGAFDIASLRYRPTSRLSIEAGRFQTSSVIWSVPGAIQYSLFRFEGNGPNVHWVDGVQLHYNFDGGWHSNLVMQWHHRNAPSNIHRYPIHIAETTPHLSWYNAVHRIRPDERLRLLTLNFLYIPNCIVMNTEDRTSGYITASVKTKLGWNLSGQAQLLWENEIGYNFNRPDNIAIGLPGENGDKARATALTSTLNYVDFAPDHSIGFLAAFVPMSFAISPFLDNNLIQYEIRHVWDATSRIHVHSFIRYQRDLEKTVGATQRQSRLFPVMWITYFFR